MDQNMKHALLFLALIACNTTEPQEGKPVPQRLKAKAMDFNVRKAKCAKVASTDDEYAKCVGVKWETLQHDQTGLHEDRNAKGELE